MNPNKKNLRNALSYFIFAMAHIVLGYVIIKSSSIDVRPGGIMSIEQPLSNIIGGVIIFFGAYLFIKSVGCLSLFLKNNN